MAINIQKITSTANTTTCAKRVPKYLVLHYTASTRSNSGQAKAIAKMFSDSSRCASADFIVDDNDIVQYNPDPTTRYCWAVGGSKYSSLTNSKAAKYYGKATNANSISIEMTSSKKSTKTMNATDKDWYFTDKVLNNTLELAAYLMDKYNIPISNVIMHNMTTGKLCPACWAINESALKGYNDFIAKLKKKKSLPTYKVDETYTLKTASFLRSSAKVDGDKNKIKYSTLSDSNKDKTINSEGYAKAKEGTKWKVKEVKTVGNDIWIKNGSGYWLPFYYNGTERV